MEKATTTTNLMSHSSEAQSGDSRGLLSKAVLAGCPVYAVRHVDRMPWGSRGSNTLSSRDGDTWNCNSSAG